MRVLLTLLVTLIASTALAEERIAFERYEVVVDTRPHYFTLPSGVYLAGHDIVVHISIGGMLVAAIADNFMNGYGALQDYGPQPGFDTPGEVQAYWEAKDTLEVYWEAIDGLILVNNIPNATLQRTLTAKWTSLYQRIFPVVWSQLPSLDFPTRRPFTTSERE
ncbi:MAG: hypothetical protein ACE5I9_05770 [Candidatus Methylomirabilales bacterium]